MKKLKIEDIKVNSFVVKAESTKGGTTSVCSQLVCETALPCQTFGNCTQEEPCPIPSIEYGPCWNDTNWNCPY